MKSDALHYFCTTFVTWAGVACLFLLTKNPKVISWQLQRPIHTQSEINKLQTEGSASAFAPHSPFISTQGQERCQ